MNQSRDSQLLIKPKQRLYWLDYLRGINIAGTLIFHAFLAYSPFIQGNDLAILPIPYVDLSTTLPYTDILLLLRPIFSMQLMFFLSGIFSWRSLQKRGALLYLYNRFRRLVIPFFITTMLVMPLTNIPGQLSSQLSLLPIRLAHLWFLWVLFAFDCIIAFFFYFFRYKIERLLYNLTNKGIYALGAFGLVVSYLLFVNNNGETGWITLFGLDFLLLPRAWIGLYLVYFILGVALGSRCLNDKVTTTNWLSPFSLSTPAPCLILTIILLPVVIFLYLRSSVDVFISFFGTTCAWLLINICYALSGLFIVSGLILISKRFLRTQNKILDNLASNSYMFYLVHYTFVVWLQFILSFTALPGHWKPFIVIVFSIPLSWFAADRLNRFNLVQKIFAGG